MFDTVVNNLRFFGRDGVYSIGINDGKFAVQTTELISGKREWDAEGDVALPPFVEMHTHLDTALTAGNPLTNKSGTLFEGIQIWSEQKQNLEAADVRQRAYKAITMLVEHGVLFIRAAVDISDPDLTALKVLLEVREAVSHFAVLQIIAFPQDGILACPENQERLETAIRLGADAVSAVPHLEHTREAGITSLEYCFTLAKQYGKFVHVFCDEIDDEHARFLEIVANLTRKTNMEGLVTASHANALAYYSDAYAQKVIQLVKAAEITIVACPLINSAMQGRFDMYPKGRGITRVKQLDEASVNICLAHDDIQTPFYPLGSGNIVQAAHVGLHLAHMTGEKEVERILQMITYNGAKSFGNAGDYGIAAGNSANFITIPVANINELMSRQPKCRFVFYQGKLITETKPSVTKWMAESLYSRNR